MPNIENLLTFAFLLTIFQSKQNLVNNYKNSKMLSMDMILKLWVGIDQLKKNELA